MESASKEVLLGSLVELLNTKEFKDDFISRVNANIDIPMINENNNIYQNINQ